MDRFESMSILVAVVEAGSLSAAARRLGAPLATVSRKVSDLETHLKTRLLNRSSRRITLTDAGQSYVAACKRILEEVGEAERAAAGEYGAPKGDLVITAPIVFGRLHVLPVAIEFLNAYPDTDIRIALADRVLNIPEDHVDLAVRIGELPDSSLMARRLGSIRRVVCGSPAYFAERGALKSPAELGAHDCVTFEGMMPADPWTFRIGKSDTSVAIHSRLIVNTAETAIDAAIAGVGVTSVLSYQAAAAVRAGARAVVLRDFELSPSPVNLIYPGQRLLPLKLRAFLDFAAPRLRRGCRRLPYSDGRRVGRLCGCRRGRRLYSPNASRPLPQFDSVGSAHAGDHVESVRVTFAVQVYGAADAVVASEEVGAIVRHLPPPHTGGSYHTKESGDRRSGDTRFLLVVGSIAVASILAGDSLFQGSCMTTSFTPLSALIGGIIIGLSATLLLWTAGRIAGISGIVGGLLRPTAAELPWRAAFVLGLIAAPLLYRAAGGATPPITVTPSLALVVLGGLLVGYGTHLGSGCTSGHGVCGLACLSPRSFAATATFLTVALVTVFVTRHFLGGVP